MASGSITDNNLPISNDDKRGVVIIITAIGVSWTALTLVIRLVSKLHVKSVLGYEEILVIIASACAFSSSACIFLAVKSGLGVSATDNLSNLVLLKCLWLSDIFYCITLAVAKGATIPLLFQLTPMKKIKYCCLVLTAAIIFWGFLSTLLIGLRCHLDDPWKDIDGKCTSLFDKWLAVEIMSISIEVILFGMFVSIIFMLRMKNSIKFKVIAAFAIRLTLIFPAVFRILYLRKGKNNTSDPLFALVGAVCATQVVLHHTTMAASFAYLKPFLRAFDSNFSATVKVDTVVSNGYPYGSSGANGSNYDQKEAVMLDDLSPNQRRSPKKSEDAITPCKSQRGSWIQQSRVGERKRDSRQKVNRYSVRGIENGHEKQNSSESMAPIIKKTQEWTVHTESTDKIAQAM